MPIWCGGFWRGDARAESGGYVLFMDGHVEWMPYPGKFPMTPAFVLDLQRTLKSSER